MQKLKRNFVESKMNKDLDDRFVPPGEYRDALNISVITNTDSSSGAVQNSKGNSSISDLSKNVETKSIVKNAVSNNNVVEFTDPNEQLEIGMYLSSEGVFPNLLTNSSFDTGLAGWTQSVDSGSNPWVWNSGGYAEKASGAANASLRQTISVVANQAYVGSFKKKYTGGSNAMAGKVQFYLDLDGSGSGSNIPLGVLQEVTGQWVTSTVEFTPTFTGNLLVMVYMHSDGTGYIDDVTIKKKATQPVIMSVSDDKTTVTLNVPVTMQAGEEVFGQYSRMLPNECVGAIEDEGEGSIYWMTSSRDDDNSRQFNFRNTEQRSNINYVTNGDFSQGGGTGIQDWTHHGVTVASTSLSDTYVTLSPLAGNTAAYPLFYSKRIKLEHGKRYKVSCDIATYTVDGSNPKWFVGGATDINTGIIGNISYRPAYDSSPSTGAREFYFIFDKYSNYVGDNSGDEGSNFVRIYCEMTQGAGGYNQQNNNIVLKIGAFSLEEYNADIAVYQDAVFEYKDGETRVVANDIYMLEAPSTAPQFRKSDNINTMPATFAHDAITKDMTWQIVSKHDDVNGVAHLPFNPSTHSGIVSSVDSKQLVLDPDFTSSGWSANDKTDSLCWQTNSTGAGNGAGDIYYSGSNSMLFNAVPDDGYIGTGTAGTINPLTNLLRGNTYVCKVNIGSYTSGAIELILYDQFKKYIVSPPMSAAGLFEFELELNSSSVGSFASNIVVRTKTSGSATTTLTLDSVEIRDKFALDYGVLEPYSGTAVGFPPSPLDYKIVFGKPKVLDFNHRAKITGINIVENMLFWTDGYSEPKKINVNTFKLGTQNLSMQSRLHTDKNNNILGVGSGLISGRSPSNSLNAHSRSAAFWSPTLGHSDSTTKILREHVTVIRKAPHQPPLVELNPGDGSLLTSFTKTFEMANYGSGGGAQVNQRYIRVGDKIPFANIIVTQATSDINVGDIMYATISLAGVSSGGYDIKFKVTQWYGNDDLTMEVLYIDDSKNYAPSLEYTFTKAPTTGLYNDKFVRFGYRYQYSDGEYSSFSPFSRPAFLPNNYNFNAIEGVNKGMVNQATSITIKGFVPQDIPKDVVGVDLLYKDSNHSNVYKMNSFHSGSAEWKTLAYGDSSSLDDSHLTHNGVYNFTSDNLQGSLPSSQLLRSWDAVPRRAVAQEVIGNRLVYGNYTQNYDIIAGGKTSDFVLEAQIINVNPEEDRPLSSCKSLRNYQVGIVYGDHFGRETPILTSGGGAVNASQVPSAGRLLLQARVLSTAPSWAKYYRHYVKETSLPYHNLVLDRWWEAKDDTVWLSFYSHDRNKLQEGDEIILKKKHGGDYVIPNPNKIKILAIENEAPDSCKFKTKKIATYNAEKMAAEFGTGGSSVNSNGDFVEHGFLGTPTPEVLPSYPRTGDVNEGEDYFDISADHWEASGFKTLHTSFQSLGPSEDIVIVFRRFGLMSERYQVLGIQTPETPFGMATSQTDRYRVSLHKKMGSDAANIVRTGRFDVGSSPSYLYNGLVVRSRVLIQAFVETFETEDYHEGRFYVKVEKTLDVKNYVMCEGRNTAEREVMEMRLPYIAHNANMYSDGTTGMSSTAPDSTPHATNPVNSSGVNTSGVSNWIPYRLKHGHYGAVLASGNLNNISTGRKRILVNKYVNGSSTPDLLYNMTDAYLIEGLPTSHYSSGASPVTYSATDKVAAVNFRGVATWEDYFTRWSTHSTGGVVQDSFWFVDKEPVIATYNWKYQYAITKDKNGVVRGGSGFIGHTNWTPMYKSQANSTTSFAAGNSDWDAGTALYPPAESNGWVDNSPYKHYHVNTRGGGLRTSLPTWNPLYGQSQTVDKNASGHFWSCFDGLDYNNGDFTNNYHALPGNSAYVSAGADVGRAQMTLSWAGVNDSANRNHVFYNYIYTQIHGWAPEDADTPLASQNYLRSSQKFYWREDPDKEIYSIIKTYHARHSKNYWGKALGDWWSYGADYSGMNRRLKCFLYLDKPHGSGPSGWAPFYHVNVNPGGAIDSGKDFAQPTYSGTVNPEYRTMVLLDNIQLNSEALKVDNAAVFETVPKESQDIDIYYESGGALPIKIDGVEPESFVPYIYVGSGIEIDYLISGIPLIFRSTVEAINKTGQLTLSDTIPTEVLINDSVRIYKVDSDDTQYTSSLVRVDPGAGSKLLYISDNTGHGGWSGIPFINCINFQNGVESNTIKDLFNESRISSGVVVSTTLDTVPREETYENGLIHSGIYNSKTGMNDFNQFIVADKITRDINPDYGSIQKLNTRDSDMTILCEDKIVRMLVNKSSLYNADGTTNVTSSDMVLGQDVPYVGEYGISKNPESFINYGYKSFFTDRNRGAVLRLSQDGLTTISKNGMESYFDKSIRGEGFLIGTYDAKKYEYNVTATLPKIVAKAVYNIEYTRTIELETLDSGITPGMYIEGDNIQVGSIIVAINVGGGDSKIIEIDKDTLSGGVSGNLEIIEKVTVSFNDVSNGWSSFRSFIPEQGISVRGEYFTYKNGSLYQHYTNETANLFYNFAYGSSITAVFNDGPEVVKDFRTLEYLGTRPKNETTHYGWYISSAITDTETGYIGNFVEKEGKYSGFIKGFNTGYTDATQFTTQGIGNIIKIENA